jgi:outer membrane protein assembly factor BamB
MTFRKNIAVLSFAALALASCGVFGGGGDKKPRTPTIGERIPILTGETDVVAEPSLADVEVLLPPAQANSDWPQPGGNASKTMEHVALGSAVRPAWNASISGTTKYERLAAGPVVGGGKLFVVDTFAKLHAFDAQSGNKAWVKQIGDEKDVKGGISLMTGEMTGNRGSLFGGGASFDEGIVYATSGLGDVVAFNAADGAQLWKVRPGGPLRGAPSVALGTVYVTSQDNQIFALKSTDGSLVWNGSASAETSGVFGVGAPAIAQGTIVAGFSSGELNAYRYENGRSLWSDALSRTSISTSVAALSDVDASPVIDRGRVFAIGKGGRMVSMELVTGQRIWEINLAGIETPWVAGEWVFVIDDSARLIALARSNGKIRWITQLEGFRNLKKKSGTISWTGPVLAGDRLIAANSEGEMINVDPRTGAVQTKVKVGGNVSFPPVVANGTLYTLTDDGRITAWR